MYFFVLRRRLLAGRTLFPAVWQQIGYRRLRWQVAQYIQHIQEILILVQSIASILYVDETAWKLGKQACYTWVFGSVADVYYRCGVGRGKDVLRTKDTKKPKTS